MLHEIFGILIECAAQKAAHFRLAADALIEPGRSTLNDQLSSDSDEEGAIQAPSSDDDERGSSRGGRQRTRAAHQTILTSEHGFEGGAPINRLRSCHGWLCAAHGVTPAQIPTSMSSCAACAREESLRNTVKLVTDEIHDKISLVRYNPSFKQPMLMGKYCGTLEAT